MIWQSLKTVWPALSRGARARRELAEAYQWLAKQPQGQLIIADLANASGFYRVNAEGVSPDDRAFSDGKRAVFGRVFRFLSLNDEEKQALAVAARLEALADATEGNT